MSCPGATCETVGCENTAEFLLRAQLAAIRTEAKRLIAGAEALRGDGQGFTYEDGVITACRNLLALAGDA